MRQALARARRCAERLVGTLCCDDGEDDGMMDAREGTPLKGADGTLPFYGTESPVPVSMRTRIEAPADQHPALFERAYQLKEVIGVGSSSKCYRCVRRKDGQEFAVKVINFDSLSIQYPNRALRRLYREVRSLQVLQHASIVRMEEFFSAHNKLYIIEEMLNGGELYDHIRQQNGLVESDARIVWVQVAQAVQHMHRRNIMHRDIKPENVLLLREGCLRAKLIDFGFSRSINGAHATSFLGTGGFLAPELRLGNNQPMYTKAVDVWALGCLLFVMIAARMPFDDSLYARPRSEFVVRFRPERAWAHVSPECKDLVRQLLHPEPLRRLTVGEALQHKWFQPLRAGRTTSESSGTSSPRDGVSVSSEEATSPTNAEIAAGKLRKWSHAVSSENPEKEIERLEGRQASESSA